MTTARFAQQLAEVLVPLGFVGAVLAAVCAIVAGVAIVRGAGGLCGGAVGVWIPCAMLSAAASFASQWLPLIVSGVALVAMLVVGAVLRNVIGVRTSSEPTRTGSVARPGRPATTNRPAPARPSLATATVATATATVAAKPAAGQG